MATIPTPAHPEFIWRFYSCQKRHYHFVIAPTEDEARSQLPDAPCIFSARYFYRFAQFSQLLVPPC
ncbi:hypothetical protein VEE15_49070 (plasmid) [Escherichia coli]|nr:hypothetical protein VEE15_49070 [Escherichia coli]